MGSLVSGARYFRDLLEATKWGGGGGGGRYYLHWRYFAYRVREHVGVV